MAIMAPEVATAAGFTAGRAGDDLGGYTENGSATVFMLAIVLLGVGLMGLWLAFHTPTQWDTTGGEFPGLFNKIMLWMQNAAGQPGPLGALTTSQPAASSTASQVENAVKTAVSSEGQTAPTGSNPLSKANLSTSAKNALVSTLNGIIPGLGDLVGKL